MAKIVKFRYLIRREEKQILYNLDVLGEREERQSLYNLDVLDGGRKGKVCII